MVVSGELASMLSTCATRRVWAEQDEGPYYRDAQPCDATSSRTVMASRCSSASASPATATAVTTPPWRSGSATLLAATRASRPPTRPSSPPTLHRAAVPARQTFLRGRQRTDAAGMVEFRTIYPGWYPGRTVHIHLMVHAEGRC